MKKENRYTVLKNKDIAAYLTNEEQEQLDDLCRKLNRSRLLAGKEILQCVVVEYDWPEYERVWEMLAARVDGPNAIINVAAKKMEKRVDECERALKVLHIWAGVDGALVPEHVRELTAKTLRMVPNGST